jgi:hypothetical protein
MDNKIVKELQNISNDSSLSIELSSINLEEMMESLKNNLEYQKMNVSMWLDRMDIKNYTINDDLTVDVNDNVFLKNKKLTKIPVKFGIIQGFFDISYNHLKDLTNCPDIVHKTFDCSNNHRLQSLIGSPKEVSYFVCSKNPLLTDLKGCTPIIKKDFECAFNHLISLEGGPKEVGGIYDCSHNELTNLKGIAHTIKNGLICSHNQITHLNDLSEKIDEVFCNHNPIQINQVIRTWLKKFYHLIEKENPIELFKDCYTACANPSFIELRANEQIWAKKMAYLEKTQLEEKITNTIANKKSKLKL